MEDYSFPEWVAIAGWVLAGGIGASVLIYKVKKEFRDYYSAKNFLIDEEAEYISRTHSVERDFVIGDFEGMPFKYDKGGQLALDRFKAGRFDKDIEVKLEKLRVELQ